MAQEGELHGTAEPVGVTAAFGHERPVDARRGEQPSEGVGIGGNAEQRRALLVGEQLPSRTKGSFGCS